MNKKYSYGNEFITDSFSLCNYEFNLNNTNNRLNYSFQLFPYSNSLFKTNIIFENLIINNYKYDFYYSFVYSNYKYIIYNCKNDYEELELSYEDEDYDVYESNNYILT
ncbi:MAG: hypothetical protein IKN46_05280, partial [Acholeplasmatales bacterium]|nr:hypothetical protein [Acholeplasmatales bacterium]